jgi:hypothetical protein
MSHERQSSSPDGTRHQALPAAVDWRHVTGAIRAEWECGACWAIAAATTMQAHIAIATGKKIDVSEQQAVDCTYRQYNGSINANASKNSTNGCLGGTYEDVFSYFVQAGVTQKQSYSYVSANNGGKPTQCKMHMPNPPDVLAGVSSYATIDSKNASDFKRILATVGPIAVALDASINWDFYSGGIMSNCSNRKLDHNAVLAGYGEENGAKYWLVQNGWDNDWGESGFIRLLRHDDPEEPCEMDAADKSINCGTCGVLSVGFYPIGGYLRDKVPKQTNTSNSCALMPCRGEEREWASCQCDSDCMEEKDCCADYQAICTPNATISSAAAYKGSCSTMLCAGNRPWLSCQCDALCKERDDCCSDYDSVCHDPKK